MTDLQKRIRVYELRLMNFDEERKLLSDIYTEVENAILNTKVELYMDFLSVLNGLKPESLVEETKEETKEVEVKVEHEEKFEETTDKTKNFFLHEAPATKRSARKPQPRRSTTKNVKQEPIAKQELKPVEQPKVVSRRKPANRSQVNGTKNVAIVVGEKGSYGIYNETGGSIESGFQNKPSAVKFAKDKGWNIVPKLLTSNEIKR